jgi:nickel/cobalt transporter (NicO) family protein
MELGLIILFWYGVLHAFGADHIVAIINFSLGKSKTKTFLITFAFALGHGLMLFIFAKVLQTYTSLNSFLAYGDIISSLVIIAMGIYLIYLVNARKIILEKHQHDGHEHLHLSFQKNHIHKETATKSAFVIGSLMGIGGVRGMLITLGVINSQSIDFTMVMAFVLGVSVVFIGFGFIINYINENVLNSTKNIKRVFTTAGIVSILVGTNMILT